ncbi:hypothetical protein RRG08_040981 [Elysia crispata]|uniref:Uncharacterized protein n=1 Tax=Elysia crispata TaxID=231223 RepID=A0AAE0ZIQ8_9GAST|nr:hypothetical protein RRG08_040981 [Elysia crispata]
MTGRVWRGADCCCHDRPRVAGSGLLLSLQAACGGERIVAVMTGRVWRGADCCCHDRPQIPDQTESLYRLACRPQLVLALLALLIKSQVSGEPLMPAFPAHPECVYEFSSQPCRESYSHCNSTWIRVSASAPNIYGERLLENKLGQRSHVIIPYCDCTARLGASPDSCCHYRLGHSKSSHPSDAIGPGREDSLSKLWNPTSGLYLDRLFDKLGHGLHILVSTVAPCFYPRHRTSCSRHDSTSRSATGVMNYITTRYMTGILRHKQYFTPSSSAHSRDRISVDFSPQLETDENLDKADLVRCVERNISREENTRIFKGKKYCTDKSECVGLVWLNDRTRANALGQYDCMAGQDRMREAGMIVERCYLHQFWVALSTEPQTDNNDVPGRFCGIPPYLTD